ncbi:MAG: carbohydrate porin [Parvibaculum sp.]|uniref:carbohydrate porin n=1 Tax=Parvibaculum sp. TaxID=2024848 RepID=UPI0025DF5FD6|nr:carbohydrate porin [Parvibaculum sp.]MCE9649063.1 carbohydrate porin [Parvibaculum sp.]
MAVNRPSGTLLPGFAALLLMGTCLSATSVRADETAERTEIEPEISASIIGTYQSPSDSRANDEASLRPEVWVVLPVAGIGGELHAHFEGTTTPRTDGVSSFFDANANVGAATNSAGHGRVQISELYYEFEAGGLSISAGLLDTTAFLDASAFAGDEHTQFMNSTLVHNATIEFPDYTLGVAIGTEGEGYVPGVTVVVGGSSGLGDNASHSYPDLFDMRSSGKGVFAGGELGWGLPALGEEGAARLGVWTNTADHAYLDGSSGTPDNKGVYGVLEGTALDTGWTLRAGLADQDVSAADWFLGAAIQRKIGEQVTLGLGVTETGLSDDASAPGVDDSTQAELYVKYDVLPHVNLTPSVQWIRNPGFDSSDTVIDKDNWIVGFRIGLDI